MGTLGFEVERHSNTTPSRSSGSRRRSERRIQVVVAGRGGKVQRHLSDAPAVVQLGVPYAQASRPQQEQQGQGYTVSDERRMANTREYARRPHSAKSLRPSQNRGRPTSASSVRYSSDNANRPYYNSGNKDMDILLEICRDQGRVGSLDPSDFDSRYAGPL